MHNVLIKLHYNKCEKKLDDPHGNSVNTNRTVCEERVRQQEIGKSDIEYRF